MTKDTPKVHVRCLAAYNLGIDHGRWIPAVDEDELREGIDALLDSSPCKPNGDYAIHEYDGFYALRLDEHESLETVAKLGAFIQEHGALGAAFIQAEELLQTKRLDEAEGRFRDCYIGEYDSLKDWAEEHLAERLTVLPEDLRGFFDYERWVDDQETSGAIYEIRFGSKTHIFWNH